MNKSIPIFFAVSCASLAFAADDDSNRADQQEQNCGHTEYVKIKHIDVPPPPPHRMTNEEGKMIKTLLLMSNEELTRLRQMISHIEKTPVEKRKKMAEYLERAMNATPEERQKMLEEARERFRKVQENLLNRYYSTLQQKEANAEREKFLKLDREGKKKYIQEVRIKLGFPEQKRVRDQADQKRNSAEDEKSQAPHEKQRIPKGK